MTQAARSGVMNNVEGNERTSTSKETEMKLTNVAHASLAELKGDYEKWLLRYGLVPWSIDSEESQRIYSLRLDPPGYGKDVVRDSCAHILAQKKKFDAWLESDNHEVVANCLLILLSRTIHMLSRQLQVQGDKFAEAGGFRERRTEVRVTARAKQEGAPDCPACGKPMKQRKAARGANAGKEYWLEPERPVEFPFELRLPMHAHVVTGIDRNVGRTPYASVHYGSLLFAWPIAQTAKGDVDLAAPWQYALAGTEVKVERSAMPARSDWPVAAPLRLTVPARAFDWPKDPQHLPGMVDDSAVAPLTLVPYGCAKFRVAMFPVTETAWKQAGGPELTGMKRARTWKLREGKGVTYASDLKWTKAAAGAKEITLRVLNGGNGYESDQAIWGLARFLEAVATDVIEESSK